MKRLPISSSRNWYEKHQAQSTSGERLADAIAKGMGSWKFIIWQTVIVVAWMVTNTIHGWDNYFVVHHWDDYPFVLLNLVFSTQAAYSAPIIMMSQNRQSARDKVQAEHQYEQQEQELKHQTQILLDQNKILEGLRVVGAMTHKRIKEMK